MRDKLLHCAVCALIVVTVARFAPLWVSATVTLLLSIGKEIFDIWHGVASWKDLLADAIGIGFGICLCI